MQMAPTTRIINIISSDHQMWYGVRMSLSLSFFKRIAQVWAKFFGTDQALYCVDQHSVTFSKSVCADGGLFSYQLDQLLCHFFCNFRSTFTRHVNEADWGEAQEMMEMMLSSWYTNPQNLC